MKQLHASEIRNIVLELQSFLDSRTQKFFVTESGVGLELRKLNKTSYLWFDLSKANPVILLFEKIPSYIKLLKTSPLGLFAKAHLEGKRISEILHRADLGRVLEFYFGYENPVKLEVRLFPHGTNAILTHENKRVSFDKIKDVKVLESSVEAEICRSLEVVTKEWLEEKQERKTKQQDPEEIRKKEIQKKESSLAKMREHLESLKTDDWARLGEWLKQNQSLDVPEKFSSKIDRKKSFSENIQICFERAKKNQDKISGTEERIRLLEKEILDLKNRAPEAFLKTQKSAQSKKNDGWKGYRLSLNDKVEVFVGKSAQENLNILRFAQSWDYWMHIKDYPGAHGIIRRPRNYEVSDEDLRAVASFIASRSKKSAHFLSPGDSFDVLVVECRYVRPIKGDKLGRVTYSNERVLHCRMTSK